MTDYKPTMFLPKTDFSLTGVKSETAICALFGETLYETMSASGNRDFFLHDGPPYANGDIHMGHALNKILKDIVNRSQYGFGKRIQYTPGWDCHGLPIEWQVEKDLMTEGKTRADYTVPEFRQLCRDYATKWVDRQREQFKTLGVVADWNKPYLTMNFETEAKIVSELHSLAAKDLLYQGTKPVLWSTVEQTALAEAEVDYKDIKVSSVYVAYPITSHYEDMKNTRVIIWTTTPWTLTASFAIAHNPDVSYGVYEVDAITNLSKCSIGDRFIVADALASQTFENIFVEAHRVGDVEPKYLVCEHPLRNAEEYEKVDGTKGQRGYLWGVPVITGKHVTDTVGTGLVHTSPDHGPEDFACWNASGMGEYEPMVNGDGTYNQSVSMLAGENILGLTPNGDYIFEFTNAKIIKALEAQGNLLATAKVVISYPHSWRSKAPLIYRNTPQWFVSMDDLRPAALAEIGLTQFTPKNAQNRLTASVETRPDWLISRQRTWGTPMALFVNKKTGQLLKNKKLNKFIQEVFAKEGGDAWWVYDDKYWLEPFGYNTNEYEKVTDVLDVWFDSGCSRQFVRNKQDQANVYLEGSDQHRGWYSSSLLMGVANHGHAPFQKLVTHGFVLDAKGKKMSKSAGNVVDPLVEAGKYGTDVLRLWVALSDYTQDMQVGSQILQTTSDQYKKFRNSLRFMISNLEGFTEDEIVHDLPPLESYMIHKVKMLRHSVMDAYRDLRFKDVCRMVMDFCANDLSAFYFDISKDSLYCDRPDSLRRRSCRTTLFYVFNALTSWMAPVLPFTTEEAWAANGGSNNSARRFYDVPEFLNPVEANRWPVVLEVLDAVIAQLEVARRAKLIGSPLEANVKLTLTAAQMNAFAGIDAATVFRTSQAEFTVGEELGVEVVKAEGTKCARSWRILPEVGSDPRYPDLSLRDADAVAYWETTQT